MKIGREKSVKVGISSFELARIHDACEFLRAILQRHSRPLSQIMQAGAVLGFSQPEIMLALGELNVFASQVRLGKWEIALRQRRGTHDLLPQNLSRAERAMDGAL